MSFHVIKILFTKSLNNRYSKRILFFFLYKIIGKVIFAFAILKEKLFFFGQPKILYRAQQINSPIQSRFVLAPDPIPDPE